MLSIETRAYLYTRVLKHTRTQNIPSRLVYLEAKDV